MSEYINCIIMFISGMTVGAVVVIIAFIVTGVIGK